MHVTGSKEPANPLINGFVLKLRDATEQRATEREVLEIASRERQRMSGEVHAGIGQNLTGIALMLKSLATLTGADARAVRRRSCTRVDVDLRTARAATALSVSDDALGGSADEEAADVLPNRLMGYRARLIGGTLRFVRRADDGSHVEVTVPPLPPST